MIQVTPRQAFTDALRYWERRRILYNAVLLGVVIAVFWAGLPVSKERLALDLFERLFVLAVLANVAYCTAYLADVFVQLSELRATWLRFRWILFVIGLVHAVILTHNIASGILGGAPHS